MRQSRSASNRDGKYFAGEYRLARLNAASLTGILAGVLVVSLTNLASASPQKLAQRSGLDKSERVQSRSEHVLPPPIPVPPKNNPEKKNTPANKQPAPAEPDKPAPPDATSAKNLCFKALKMTGVTADWLGTATKSACAIEKAVRLKSVSVAGGTVAIAGGPTITCEFAALFGRWVAETAHPIITLHAGSAPARISTGPGLVCRTRNNKPGAKLSEHAKGNAIDISAIRLLNRKILRIEAKQDKREALILRALRTSACGYFKTVLGPGSNAAHATHFHFDAAKRRSDYRLCE